MKTIMKDSLQKIFSLVLLFMVPLAILLNFSLLKTRRNHCSQFATHFIQSTKSKSVEKPFVFLLYSTTPTKGCEQNISSILQQKYANYRILLIETKNMQTSGELLRQIAAKYNKSHLFTTLFVDEESPTIASFQEALSLCNDEEVIIQFACNDWLLHNHVLEKLNAIYSSFEETWLTYSQYLEYPSYQKSTIAPYLKKMLRNRRPQKIPWISAPLKTYYAGLFKQIPLDTRFNNHKALLPETLDLYLLPLAEQAKNHIYFIKEALYVHNTEILGHTP